MSLSEKEIAELKRTAGIMAAKYVQNSNVVGLGTGSTVYFTIMELARRIKEEGLQIVGIPTSEQTAKIAAEAGIALTTLRAHPVIDITIDGADEIDPDLNLIKGLGGALLREKIVAKNSKTMVVVADESKLVNRLGTKTPVPVEVIKFGTRPVEVHLRKLGCGLKYRLKNGLETTDENSVLEANYFITDEQNYIIDCYFQNDGGINGPRKIEKLINNIPGVVENGLFLNMAKKAVIAGPEGVKTMEKKK